MKLFFKNIKDEINNNKKVWIPSLIIIGLAVFFSLFYVSFKSSKELNSDIIMIIIMSISTLIFIVILFSLLIYTIHKIPSLKPVKFALLLSIFLALFTASKLRNFDIDIYLQIIIGLLVFITVFIISYKSKKMIS